MKQQTALARRNVWMRQLKRLRNERNRRVEDEPEGKFRDKPVRGGKIRVRNSGRIR
jgi:hypothetical protein